MEKGKIYIDFGMLEEYLGEIEVYEEIKSRKQFKHYLITLLKAHLLPTGEKYIYQDKKRLYAIEIEELI